MTHEYLEVAAGETLNLTGISFIDHASGSNRVDKFQRNIDLLAEAITTEPDAGIVARYTFYLANSYRDSGQKEPALTTYLERARLGSWYQEVFVSLLNAARLKEALDHAGEDVIAAYSEATASCPTRSEALHGAARTAETRACTERGYGFAVQGPGSCVPDRRLVRRGLDLRVWPAG